MRYITPLTAALFSTAAYAQEITEENQEVAESVFQADNIITMVATAFLVGAFSAIALISLLDYLKNRKNKAS